MRPQIQANTSPAIKRDKSWKVWWRLTRPHTLTAAFVPVTLGTIIAMTETAIHFGLFLTMLIASLFIQIATNLFNEYYDFKRGLDNEESVGIGGGIVRDGLKPKTVMKAALLLYAVSLLLGVYICMNSSWWIAAVGSFCMAMGYLYTGGPMPISYTPFGELASGLLMGMFIVLIAYFIQTGTVSIDSILIATPIMILVGLINLANNIRDLEGDKEHGRKTLAVLFGKRKAVIFMAVMFAFSYLWAFSLIGFGILSPWIALIVFSIPKPIKAIREFIRNSTPPQMMPAMKAASQTNTIFGILLSLGIFIGYLF